jgi:hypothetical protein
MRELTSDMVHRAAIEYANWRFPGGIEPKSDLSDRWLTAYEAGMSFMPAALASAFGISTSPRLVGNSPTIDDGP